MKIEKKVLAHLTKCYSIAPLFYEGEENILVAAEKTDECLLFDAKGNQKDVVWEKPGGTMSMVQIPGSNGEFLATQKFYSPNDADDAKIVLVTPRGKGKWEVKTLVNLPYVHRFDILTQKGENYLIACTIKSGNDFKGDWSKPGKVYGAKLPKDLSEFHEGNQLELQVLMDNLLKNHGYYRIEEDTVSALVSAENGVYLFTPPVKEEENWSTEKILDEPCSDALLLDLDQDGEKELAVIAPFHGETIRIYKKQEGQFQKDYEYTKPLPFSHAIYGSEVCKRPTLLIGNREGEQELLAFTYDREKETYHVEVIDKGCGPANVYHYVLDGVDKIIATNREIDEVAMYTLTEEK